MQPGESFSFVGHGGGDLSREITIWVDGVESTRIHTSCSEPVGPGLLSGDFLVEAGASRDGGTLCPLPAACSEAQEAHQRVVWHRFESNRANAFGHQYQAYLWRRPLSRSSVFSLWIQAEDERLSGDAIRTALSVSPCQPGSR